MFPLFLKPDDPLIIKLAASPGLLILSDFDGTLVPLAPRPQDVQPDPMLLKLLERMTALPATAVGIVSGRTIKDLRQWLKVPGLFLAGFHGSKLAPPGGEERWLISVAGIETQVQSFKKKLSAELKDVPGLIIEDKGYNLALHYRLAARDQAQEAQKTFVKIAAATCDSNQFQILRGNQVLEIRPRAMHKGTAVQYFKSKYPGWKALYLGDDTTDEDAFQELSPGDVGVLIAQKPRQTRAAYRLASPAQAQELLREIVKHRGT